MIDFRLNHNSSADSVPLRLGWALESEFTRWLTVHLNLLGGALGLRLRVLTSKGVGEDRIADLFARDEDDGSVVLIENQLQRADDAHLGQILAYLAGSTAKTMVWIAESFEARHLAAVRWLNDATRDDFRFFAVRVRIANGDNQGLEPAFDVIEGPSNWTPPANRFGPIQTLSFPANFWAYHLRRHPEEARQSRQIGPRCRWRATKLKGIVIGQFVQENTTDVFLRGANGVPLQEAEAKLTPFIQAIEARLEVTFRCDRLDMLARKSLTAHAAHSSNWRPMSDWLKAQSDAFDAILGELDVGERRNEGGRLRN